MSPRPVLLGVCLGLSLGWLHAETAAPGAASAAPTAPAAFTPEGPTCEYRTDPLGIDLPAPRLAWTLRAARPDARGLAQTAYRILVASSPEKLAHDEGDLWDSGRVTGDAMNQIPYGGQPLATDEACWWKVEAWDQDGHLSAWSAPAQWTMGVLAASDWSGAQWIGGAGADAPPSADGPRKDYETVLLRREFTVKPGLRRALIDVCGLGLYEMSLNGERVGDALLAPGWTQYEKTCLYDTYDITAQLQPGLNAAGLLLGNGTYLCHGGRFNGNTKTLIYFAPLQAIARLRLEYADGTYETIVTDAGWKTAPGPITFSSIYGGEDYDARREPPGWNQPGFVDGGWAVPRLLQGTGGALRGLSCAAPPVRGFEELRPVAQKEIRPGVTVYDLGQNASVIARIAVYGEAGARVRIIPAEIVHPDGTVDRETVGGGDAWWEYTLKGDGETEGYLGKFFYHGARYFQVERYPAPGRQSLPRLSSVEGLVIHADCAPVGDFSCANPLFNQVYSLVRWAQQNNMISILTDCPARERRSWLEQDYLNGPSLRYNFALDPLFTKLTHDMADAQQASGLVPSTAPDYTHWKNDFSDSPEWGSAVVLVPWQQYEFAGDTGLLARAYPAMAAYQSYLAGRATGFIAKGGLGDWFDLGPGQLGYSQLTPLELTATAFYYEDTRLLARIARLLGKKEDAARYAEEAKKIAAAFQAKFYDPATHQYGDAQRRGSQCSNALALVMDLVPPADRAAVVANLAHDVETKGLTAGDIGYRYLLRALADAGRSDLIYRLNNQTEKPGYGYQVARGKTSLTEGWDGSHSQDHFMLGQINEWFYHDLAGIQPDPAAPGFARIVLHPAFVPGLDGARAAYRSIRGPIVSEWMRDGTTLSLHVTIPPNVTATLRLPAARGTVQEGARPAEQASGVRWQGQEGDEVIYAVASGDYRFSFPAR